MDDDMPAARGAGHRRLDDRLPLVARLQHAFARRAAQVDAVHAGVVQAIEELLEHGGHEPARVIDGSDGGREDAVDGVQ
jgi:hypothetical protein